MDTTKTEESIDQPTQESEVEQPVAESEDQPKEESEEGEDKVVEEATEEDDSQEEEIELPDGNKVPLEELRKGYMRMSDYTKKTQELARTRTMPQPPVHANEPNAEEAAALETLKRLGVARNTDVEDTVRRMMAQQSMATERRSVQDSAGLDDESMDIAQFIAYKRGIPLSKAAEQLTSTGKKFVKRKALSPSSDVTTSASSKKGIEITPEYIRNLDPNSKEFAKIQKMLEDGEL